MSETDTLWKIRFCVKTESHENEETVTQAFVEPCLGCEVLDESPAGYADILNSGEFITESHNWSNATVLIAASNDDELTTIEGDKFIGIRIQHIDGYLYGWIKIGMKEFENKFEIETNGYCYRTGVNESIQAGQTD